MGIVKTLYIDDDLYKELEKVKPKDMNFNKFINLLIIGYYLSRADKLSEDDVFKVFVSFLSQYKSELKKIIVEYFKDKVDLEKIEEKANLEGVNI